MSDARLLEIITVGQFSPKISDHNYFSNWSVPENIFQEFTFSGFISSHQNIKMTIFYLRWPVMKSNTNILVQNHTFRHWIRSILRPWQTPRLRWYSRKLWWSKKWKSNCLSIGMGGIFTVINLHWLPKVRHFFFRLSVLNSKAPCLEYSSAFKVPM